MLKLLSWRPTCPDMSLAKLRILAGWLWDGVLCWQHERAEVQTLPLLSLGSWFLALWLVLPRLDGSWVAAVLGSASDSEQPGCWAGWLLGCIWPWPLSLGPNQALMGIPAPGCWGCCFHQPCYHPWLYHPWLPAVLPWGAASHCCALPQVFRIHLKEKDPGLRLASDLVGAS